jgi:hypothetical protein
VPDCAQTPRRPRRPRPLENVSPEKIEAATRELVEIVERRFPERFYRESQWRVIGHALIARITGLTESMALLIRGRRPSDTIVLLRALYEHVVMFSWLAINPEARIADWASNSRYYMKKLHNDALDFGVEVLTTEELEQSVGARALDPRLPGRAAEVDDYWGPRIPGFRVQPDEGPKDILTFRGMYASIYRIASRSVHAQVETVDPCIDHDRYPSVVQVEDDGNLIWSALAVPLFAMALLVCHERFGWPDPEVVNNINNGLTTVPEYEGP